MLLCDHSSTSDIETSDINKLTYVPIPENEIWRLDILKELLHIKCNSLEVEGFDPNEINDLIDYICIS